MSDFMSKFSDEKLYEPYAVVSGINKFDEKTYKVSGETTISPSVMEFAVPFKDDSVEGEVSKVKASVDYSFFEEPTGLIPFSENLKRIDAYFKEMGYNLVKTGYSIGNERNEMGKNEGTLKVLIYALLKDLTLGETLNLFSEHFRDVLFNPESGRHGNIRALGECYHDMRILTLYLEGYIRFDKVPML